MTFPAHIHETRTILLFAVFVFAIIAVFGGLMWALFRKGIDGRKFLTFVVAFFGFVIAVNVVMAVRAVNTFPGLDEEDGNGYDESQAFDQLRAAQLALGWTVHLDYADKTLTVAFTGKDGKLPEVGTLHVLVGRPTETSQDQRPAFVRSGATFRAPVTLAPGKWMVKVSAVSADGTRFSQRLSLLVTE